MIGMGVCDECFLDGLGGVDEEIALFAVESFWGFGNEHFGWMC